MKGPDLISVLAKTATYPHHPQTVEVRETHISWVFLAGERVYKLKKPLVLPFLDYRTPKRRRQMCREEVRLNSRLAPDVYIGVRGVSAAGTLTDDDDRAAVDYLVEMQRYDERDTLASKLERGELERQDVIAVAAVLARFHQDARRAGRRDGGALIAVERQFERNIHELLQNVEQRAEVGRVLALERFAHAFALAHEGTLHARRQGGFIREVHGDLRADHVLVDSGRQVRIVDCVEFDREMRELDVADDLAFLVVDLAAGGAEELAHALTQAYREAGGDPGDGSLIAFYACYRALVRAKVALLRAGQHPLRSAARGHASAQGRELISLAERFAWRARLPLAIVVCGVPASGKSVLASALAERSGLPHLSSDLTRKRLAGIAPARRGGKQIYDPAFSARTYSELGRRAKAAVASRRGAIVDATFRRHADREAFAGAFAAAAPLLFLECHAPAAVLAKRAARRDRAPDRVSDADLTVVMRELGNWEPLDEVSAGCHVALRTDRATDDVLDDLLALLDQRLPRPT